MAFKRHAPGYSLVEMLTVIAIIAILVGISVPTIPGLMRANKVTSGLSALNETLAQARQYALSNNTYVWVVFSPPAATGVDQPLKVAVLASLTGTDCLNWTTTSVSFPSTAAPGSQLQMVNAIQNLHGVTLQDTPGITFANPPPTGSATLNEASNSGMTINMQVDGQIVPFTYAIQFTPMGEALVGSSMSRYIEFDVYSPQGGSGSPNNSANQAVLCISGLTGATTIYRN